MDQTMQHFNQYSTDSALQWDGLHSKRFARTRIMFPPKDNIQIGMKMPVDRSLSGRKHYHQNHSDQYNFKPRLKQFPSQMQHWHLRASSKKIIGLQFSQPHSRRQKHHFQEPVYQHPQKYAGVQTFYGSRLKQGKTQYLLQDRMQRKSRIDQLQLRRTAFKDESFIHSKSFQRYRWGH